MYIIIRLKSFPGRSDHVYQCQLTLAEYFSSKNDLWLADYFYQQCLETSLQIRGDGHRKEAEANYNLAISAEKKMNFIQAVDYAETSYDFSKGKAWEDEGELHWKNCVALQRNYTSIAEKVCTSFCYYLIFPHLFDSFFLILTVLLSCTLMVFLLSIVALAKLILTKEKKKFFNCLLNLSLSYTL